MSAPQTSDPEWTRLDDLFQRAMDLPASERAAFLRVTCGDDAQLYDKLSALLQAAGGDDDFLSNAVETAAYSVVNRASAPKVVAGAVFARYIILAEIGTGGMGKVYVAEDRTLKRRIALKMLTAASAYDADSVRRFRKEAEAASALNHPNILTIYEVGDWQETQFIASEFIDGETIRQRLRRGQMSIREALEVAVQIASGLAVAHTAGLIHRDIKPENILIRNDGLVKIVDFGIARFTRKRVDFESTNEASNVDVKTSIGMVIGTTRYMSPEQARGQTLDARTDIFSLGVVLYEMVSGHAAFDGDTDSDRIAAILKTDPPPLSACLPKIPLELVTIIYKSMSKDRDARYADGSELLADLKTFRADLDFQERLHSIPGNFENEVKSKWHLHPALVVLAFVAVLLLGAFVWRLMNPGPSSSLPTRSLAILPFHNNHPDPATDFLGYSLADAVITKMSYVSSVSVRPSSSIDRYRNQNVDPRQAGSDLNVDTLLMGSYLKDGDDLRINTQLVDVKHDRILWRDSFDVKYDHLLTVQDRVAAQVIAGLELNLSPAEEGHVRFDNPIGGTAYEEYLRGVDLYALNDFAGSIARLEDATRSDPGYALAWAHLGQAYETNASQQFGGREQYVKALAAYQRALRLNPSLIEPQVFIANLFTDTGRAEEAVPVLQAALRSNHNNAEAHWELGYAFRFGGLLDQSLKECQRARELDPQVKINSSALNTLLYLGRYEDFLKSLPAHQSAYILFYRGFGEYYLADYTRALKQFDDSFALDANLLQARVGEALALGIRHQDAAGLKLLVETERKIQESGVSDAEGIYKVAQAYAVLHDTRSALRLLKASVEHGFFPYPYFQSDPLMAGLRADPGYAAIASEAKERYDQFRIRFRDADELVNALPPPGSAPLQ